MTDAQALDTTDERDQMERALLAIRDHPGLARLIANTTLQLIDANRAVRFDILVSSETPASSPPSAALDRCDTTVNNGMGEPTECGRTLPCEYHAPPASPPQPGIFTASLAADIRETIGKIQPATMILDEDFWREWVAEWFRSRGLQMVGDGTMR